MRKGGAGGRGCSEDGLLGGLCETVYVFLDHSVGWFWQAEVQMVCGRWCVFVCALGKHRFSRLLNFYS